MVYEFFSVVDGSHDDPSIYPTLSEPQSPYPFDWEPADGQHPFVYVSKRIAVSQYTGAGWTKIRAFRDLRFIVVVTDARLVVYCEKFTKGGGWWGFGAIGLPVALVANAVSHARAAARRRGKLLVGQVRYAWLRQVGILTDKRGRTVGLRLAVDAGSRGEPRVLALDVMSSRDEPAMVAARIAQLAAHARLMLPADVARGDADVLRALVVDPAPYAQNGFWSLPAGLRVGQPPPRPTRSMPPPSPEQPPPPLAAPPADTDARQPNEVCDACGHPRIPGMQTCSRCGKGFGGPAPQPPVAPAVATTNRAQLRQQLGLAAPAAPATPLPAAPPRASNRAGGQATPLEVWVVVLVMLAAAGLLLYPVARYGLPLVGTLFSPQSLARAFAALVWFVFVLLAGAGIGLLALGVGLLRGSRVAQWLTCVLCGVVAVAEFVPGSNGEFASPATSGTSAAVAGIMCAVVVVLVALLPGARRFFGRDADRPSGVLVASAVAMYFGAVIAIDGLLLIVCGVMVKRFVWYGLGLVVLAAMLMGMVRPLRAGRSFARAVVGAALIGCVVLMFAATASGGSPHASLATLLPLGLAAAGLCGLWLAPSSRRHFASPGPLRPVSGPAVLGWVGLLVATLTLAGISLAAGSPSYASASSLGYSYDAPATNQPPAYSDSGQQVPTLTNGQAVDAVRAQLDSLIASGAAPDSCDGQPLDPESAQSYTIDDVSPETSGSFAVSATVTLADGSTELVTYYVGESNDGSACLEQDDAQTQSPPPPTEPTDVPSVPSRDEPVPTDASLPDPPQSTAVLAYTDGTVPSTAGQMVEWRPSGLSSAEAAAVRDIIGFMVAINQQRFGAAWNLSTEARTGASPTAAFRRGYVTSRFYQVAFGQPQTLASDLIAVPARFVSRQDPAAQGAPPGVTDCTYWPQYVFVVVATGSSWRVDVAGAAVNRPELAPLKRPGNDGQSYVNPINQRVSC